MRAIGQTIAASVGVGLSIRASTSDAASGDAVIWTAIGTASRQSPIRNQGRRYRRSNPKPELIFRTGNRGTGCRSRPRHSARQGRKTHRSTSVSARAKTGRTIGVGNRRNRSADVDLYRGKNDAESSAARVAGCRTTCVAMLMSDHAMDAVKAAKERQGVIDVAGAKPDPAGHDGDKRVEPCAQDRRAARGSGASPARSRMRKQP